MGGACPTASDMPKGRQRGIITKPRRRVNDVEVIEIEVIATPGQEITRMTYYCDGRDISVGYVGEVSFMGIPKLGIATAVTFMFPSGTITDDSSGLVKRKVVNATPMQSQVEAGLSHRERTIMAKRPDEELSIGFPIGWRDGREVPDISHYPWAALLEGDEHFE